MDIWQFNRALMRRLFIWNVINIVVGVLLSRRGAVWEGIGSQNIGWGVINILIAIFGSRSTSNRLKKLDNPDDPKIEAKETRNLTRLLWINAGLDILYMFGGWRFAKTQGKQNHRKRGVGLGIIVQGLLLFVWDVSQALIAPKPPKTK